MWDSSRVICRQVCCFRDHHPRTTRLYSSSEVEMPHSTFRNSCRADVVFASVTRSPVPGGGPLEHRQRPPNWLRRTAGSPHEIPTFFGSKHRHNNKVPTSSMLERSRISNSSGYIDTPGLRISSPSCETEIDLSRYCNCYRTSSHFTLPGSPKADITLRDDASLLWSI